ncbi:helix-turn-helix domain-containing protein [Sporosarcina sp. 179-K 3D1 HS]|uniref:helix-turn-helix domain-containing protein n=1 Tax=Sporosarcina sp. 179-K 3D1 HS TaxID=3232169 RepID=UPI00399FB352
MTSYLEEFTYFTDTQDLNEAVKRHVAKHWNNLTATERTVLYTIRRYSTQHGAAHLRHGTIEQEIGKSNSTVRRAIRKLEKLGIIKRVHFIRPAWAPIFMQSCRV